VDRAENEWGVKYIKGHPGRIDEDPETKDLVFYYADIATGGIKKMVVDLVILCPALVPREDNRGLAEIMGLKLDEYCFFKCKDLLTAPIDTSVLGIYICGYCESPKDIPESVMQASAAAARASETLVLTVAGEVR
jgi:heterodisulfide reductase subunit A